MMSLFTNPFHLFLAFLHYVARGTMTSDLGIVYKPWTVLRS